MLNRLILIVLCTFYSVVSFAQPRRVIISKPQANYFIDAGKVRLHKGVNCMVITKKEVFYKVFGITKYEVNRTIIPDFSKNDVLVLALPVSNKQPLLTFTDAVRAGNFLEVYCKIDKQSPPMTYTMQHVTIGIIPKYPAIKVVKFYDQRKHLIEKVKLK